MSSKESIKEFFLKRKQMAGVIILLIIGVIVITAGIVTTSARENIQEQESTAGDLHQTEAAPEIHSPRISEEENKLLGELAGFMEQGDFPLSSKLLMENEKSFQKLFYESLGGELYLYQSRELKDTLDGKGLVLKTPNTIFYGDFQTGDPHGEAAALQAITLDKVRYDFSIGFWQEGWMEDKGVIGYHYYDGADGEESVEITKSGMFVHDVMEGSVKYSSTNSDGARTVWSLDIDHGEAVIDERWEYDEEKKEYLLLSDTDSSHKFVLNEAGKADVRWKNMVAWKKQLD